jgi:hypothetical protein
VDEPARLRVAADDGRFNEHFSSVFQRVSNRQQAGDFSRPHEGIVPQKQQIVEHSEGVCFNL